MPTTVMDDGLLDWSTLEKHEWPTLLIGNGASINLWSGFRHDSPLWLSGHVSKANGIFTELDTTNFETTVDAQEANLPDDAGVAALRKGRLASSTALDTVAVA